MRQVRATPPAKDGWPARLYAVCRENGLGTDQPIPVSQPATRGGFKRFVDGLLPGSTGFGGEESARGSFIERAGGPWSTNKDGIIMGLLA